MKRVFFFMSIMALSLMTVAQQGPQNAKIAVEKGPNVQMQLPASDAGKAQWDIDLTFQTPYNGFQNVETDGKHFYISQWNSEYFYEADMDGTIDAANDWFIIAGVSSIRDMAYVPSTGYFYGSDVSMNIYVMDFVNKQLIETIPVTCAGITGVRHISFDPRLDNNKGGFWIGNYNEIGAVSMTGAELVSNTATPMLASCTGSAFDRWTDPANPKLWFHVTNAGVPQLVEFDINTLAFTGVTHQTTDVPGYQSGDLAGGCATYSADGKHYVVVDMQCLDAHLPNTNIIAAYELATYTVPVSNWAIFLSIAALMMFVFVGYVIKK